jgi:arylsulfatase A-like enzyme
VPPTINLIAKTLKVPLIVEIGEITSQVFGGSKVRLVNTPVSAADLFPTILEYAGLTLPMMPNLDGESIYGVIKAASLAESAVAESQLQKPIGYHYKGGWGVVDRQTGFKWGNYERRKNLGLGIGIGLGLGQQKELRDGGYMLFDVHADPGETINLMANYTEYAAKLRFVYASLEICHPHCHL